MTTTDDILIRIQMTLEELLAVARHIETNLAAQPPYSAVSDEFDEPNIDDEPPPDYGPPGSGAVIVEYD
jgi:hypothetical protein